MEERSIGRIQGPSVRWEENGVLSVLREPLGQEHGASRKKDRLASLRLANTAQVITSASCFGLRRSLLCDRGSATLTTERR